MQIGIAVFTVAIICEQAHVLSPIVLAWSHSGLRAIALRRPIETMLLPSAAIGLALALPFMVVWWVYWVWNIYHFGAQHYGVSRILGWRSQRWAWVSGTAIVMVGVPLIVHAWWWRWVALVIIDFNHWLVDIGLSSRVARNGWFFVAVVAAAGCMGFLWLTPRVDHIATRAWPWVIQARWGVGIAHFLYSRWVWTLRDPAVGAIIRPCLKIR